MNKVFGLTEQYTLFFLGFLLLILPITLLVVHKQQELRQQAATPDSQQTKVLCENKVFDGYTTTPFDLQSTDDQNPNIQKIIRNCTFRNASQKAIKLKRAKNVLIEGSTFENIRTTQAGSDLHAITINCTADLGSACTIAKNLDMITIRNNTFRNITGDGIQLGSTNRTISNIIIENNTFTGAPELGENGVDVKGVDGPVYIRGNTFQGYRPCVSSCSGSPSGPGLNIGTSNISGTPKNIFVENNDIFNNTTGIKLDGFEQVTLRNNTIHDNLESGLRVFNVTSNGLHIISNRFTKNGNTHVSVSGSIVNCTQGGNIFSGAGTIIWGPCQQVSVTSLPTTTVPTGSPTISQTGIPINVTVFLHGIGKGGDNVTPNSGGNPNPLHTQRSVSLEIFDSNNQLHSTKQGIVMFNTTAGNFQGMIHAGNIPSGAYIITLKVPNYLKKSIPGIVTVTSNQTVTVSPIRLVTGDTNNDNAISILDYNLLIDCFSELSPARNCNEQAKQQATDLTDDGVVNQFDYNLFLRELSVQGGA